MDNRLSAVMGGLTSIKSQSDTISEVTEGGTAIKETGQGLTRKGTFKKVKDNVKGRRRRKFGGDEKQSYCSEFVERYENLFVYKFYQKLSIISGSLLALFAFCNDFISDIQVLILVSTIGFNDGDYRCILIVFIMLFAMFFQYFLAVRNIYAYLHVCKENVFGTRLSKFLLKENKNITGTLKKGDRVRIINPETRHCQLD